MPDLDQIMEDPNFHALSYEAKQHVIRSVVPEFSKLSNEDQRAGLERLIGAPPEPSTASKIMNVGKSLGKEVASSLALTHLREGLQGKVPNMLEPSTPGPTETEAAMNPEANATRLLRDINSRVVGGAVGGVQDIINLSLLKGGVGLLLPKAAKEALGTAGENLMSMVGVKTPAQIASATATKALEETAARATAKTGVIQNLSDLLTAKAQDMTKAGTTQDLMKVLDEVKQKGKQNLIQTMTDKLNAEANIESLVSAHPMDKKVLLKKMGVWNPDAGQVEDQAANAIQALSKAKFGPTDLSGQLNLQIERAKVDNPDLFSAVKAGTTTEDLVNTLRSPNPEMGLTNLIKDAKEFDITKFHGKEPVPPTTTIFEEVNNIKRDFFKALPLDQQVAQGLDNISRGQSIVATPMTASVGKLSIENEEILKTTAHPWLMYLQRWMLPQAMLGMEAPGKELYSLVRGLELRSSALSQKFSGYVSDEAMKHTPSRRLAIGQFLDGQGTPLTNKEIETAGQLRKIFNLYADRAGIPKEGRITEYMTHFFDDVSGQPKDMVGQMAGKMALDDARAGKMGQLGSDILSSIRGMNKTEGTMADSFNETLSKMKPDIASKYLQQAQQAMKGLPNEAFFGPLSRRRVTDLSPENLDFHDVMTRYIAGAERKITLDKVLSWWNDNSARFSPELRTYAQSYLNAFRGVMGEGEAMQTIALNKAAQYADDSGQAWKASLYRGLVPRTMSLELRKWQFNAKIGGNFASALVNLTQTVTNTMTEIGYGPTLKAIRQYVAGGDEVRRFLQANGITYQPISGTINETTYGSLTRTMAFMFRQTEEFNRGVAFMAGYNTAKESGMKLYDAIKAGQNLVDKTQFAFSKSNIPTGFQGPLTSLLFQFRTYTVNQIKFLASTYAKGAVSIKNAILHGQNPGEDFAKMVRLNINLGLMGGAASYSVGPLVGLVTAEVGETNLEPWVKKTLLYGIPGLANLDLSEQVGLKTLPDVPSDASAMGRGLRTAFGPAVSGIATVVLDGMAGELADVAAGKKPYPNPDITKQFFKDVLRNLPFGVGAERAIEGTIPYTGMHNRLTAEETPNEQMLRSFFGARSTNLTSQLKMQQFGDTLAKAQQEKKQGVEDTIIRNINDIQSGRMSLDTILKQYGATEADIPWGQLPNQLIQTQMPLLARKYLFQWDKQTKQLIQTRYPQMYLQILGQVQRSEERLNANQGR